MPVLKNPKWEAFAQGLAKGKTGDQAYTDAGYAPNRKNASRLRTNEDVSSRVNELLGRAATRAEITSAKLTEMFIEDRKLARELGQPGAAVSAGMAIGKLHGLFIDRSINETVHYVLRAPEPAKTIDGWLEGVGRKQIKGGE